MLWCSNQYINTIDDIRHHKKLLSTLKNMKYDNILNTLFYGIPGSGKKSIVMAYVKYIISQKFRIPVSELIHIRKTYTCQANKKNDTFTYFKTKYYYCIDVVKLGKNKLVFFDKFLKNIIQANNINNYRFNIIVLLNYDIIEHKFITRFRHYAEKCYKFTRFICITNKPSSVMHLKLIGFINIRISRPTSKETQRIIKDILKIEKPTIKTHTDMFQAKLEKIILYSNGHLAKSIFYAQLLYEYGMVQLKNIAAREDKTFHHIFSLITSNKLKNIQDIHKTRNTTKLTEPTTLKLKRVVYQCVMNTDNYETVILRFFKYLIKNQSEFFHTYNIQIVKLLDYICEAHTTTNKTSFIIVECFFMKLMTLYALDNISPT